MIENNNETSPRTPSRNGAKEESGPSRRNSASSQLSSSTTSPNYDSGNISDLNISFRPTSFSSAEDDSISNDYGEDNKFQQLLREKDQSLFLALQDVRKLKSELERLSKSEKWYKSELRLQKNSRMEILEKLYTNERKFTQENQRLQDECVALYARCSEVENQLQTEKNLATKLLQSSSKTEAPVDDGVFSRDFEFAQLQEKIADQEQLIDMLRNQKRSLLHDLQKLCCEKDDIIHPLQNNIAQLEDENRTITKRCLQLVQTKIELKEELLTKDTHCGRLSNELLDLQITVKGLEEKLHLQIADLNQKEHQVNNLRIELSQRQHSEENIGSLQKKHQQELLEKQQAIYLLKDSIRSLETELSGLNDLRTRFNEQQSRTDQLEHLLEVQTSDLEELRRINERKSNQSSDHSANTLQQLETTDPSTPSQVDQANEELLLQNIRLQAEVNSTKHEVTSQSLELDNLRKTKQELKQLTEKYLQVCKLYEKSKFDLDMKDITVEKYKFEKEKDTREIGTLRERLVEASKNLECQKSLSTEFEFALSKTQQEKRRLETENKCNMDTNSKLKAERSQNEQILNDKDEEIENLRTQLYEVEDKLAKRIASMNQVEMSSSESRVASIRKLIAQQSDKVHQLNEEQKEWEHLLTSIEREDSPIDVDINSHEFDNLNQLFEDQNLGLMQLNESFHQESVCLWRKFEIAEQENKTFQQELASAKSLISDLEKQVDALESANCDYQKEIAHLAGTNERLIDDFNEDYSRERENHKLQTKHLQLEIKHLTAESDECKAELQQLQLNTSYLKDAQKLLATCDSDSQRDDSIQGRILQNVIETEHRRKMSRYDIHIRSLLSSVKSYRKNLDIAEHRYATVLAKMNTDMIGIEEFRALETEMDNLRTQLDASRREVNALKHQLKTVRDQFYVNDASKSSNTMDLTNLMDDYKKLIQQSQTATKRPSTSDIYKLINKSNNFVPNLTNISTSVDGLREDIQQMCTFMQQSAPAGRGSPQPQRKMSLLEELKLAESGTLC